MKKSNWKLLINPFDRIAGWKAFGIGIVIMALTVYLSSFANLYFDGAIDAHIRFSFDWTEAIICQLTAYLSLVVSFYLSSIILSKGIRFEDLLGTIALARVPYLLLSLFAMIFAHDMKRKNTLLTITGKIDPSQLAIIVLFGFVSLIFVIWSVILMFNAYKVSSGLKGTKLTISFFVALFFAEIVSLVCIYLTLKPMSIP